MGDAGVFMVQALLGLALGTGIGVVNQLVIWLLVGRLTGQRPKGAVFEFTGGLIVRLALDALALYLAWRWWGTPLTLIMTVSGLLLVSGISAGWQYRMGQSGYARR